MLDIVQTLLETERSERVAIDQALAEGFVDGETQQVIRLMLYSLS